MNDILKLFLSMSLSGSLLILLLFLCKPFVRDRFSKRWQYYIWLIVIARLLLPFAPANNLMENLFGSAGKTSLVEAIPTPEEGTQSFHMMKGTDSDFLVGERAVDDVVLKGDAAGNMVPSVHARYNTAPEGGMPIQLYLGILWLGVALILLIRNITIYQSFVTYIRAGWEEVTEIDRLNRLSQLEEQLGIRRPVELYTNSLISSPLLLGFFRPCIVLPTTDLPDVEFQYTITHELMHFKRLDMFYKWLMQITLCLHWFNPFVWLMRRELDRACELACDEAVIRTLNPQERRAYGDTLLHAAGAGGSYKSAAASLTLSESARLLKERMAAIIGFKKSSTWITALSVLLAAELTAGATVAGAAFPSNVLPEENERELSVTTDHAEGEATVLQEWEQEAYAGTWNDEVYEMAEINGVPEIAGIDMISGIGIPGIDVLKIKGKTYYLIVSEEQLRSIPLYGLDKDYMQQGDIYLSWEEWEPIGTVEEPFTGSYNGNGYEIGGLTMTDPGAETIGLFGAARNAHIYNITLRDFDIEPAGIEESYVSPILGVELDNVRMYDNYVYSDTDMSFPWSWKDEMVEALAEEYYQNVDYYNFGQSFAQMDEESRQEWLKMFYDKEDIAFFSAVLWQLELQSALFQEFAGIAYEDDNLSFFSVLAEYMDEDMLESWLDRAMQEGKISFQWMILNALGREQELLEQPDREEQILAECEAYGLTRDGSAYYYHGQMVRVLMEFRQYASSSSVRTLDMNREGAVNIKVISDAYGRVVNVDYITKAEMKKWFGGSEYAEG